ncbi:hypothetical protein GG851_02420 [Bordetella petrii]|nr:hypothetical protein [Bordetella petrii]
MQLNHLVTILSVACLLSACGFAPPAPPQPADSPRIAINNGDPRLEPNRQDVEVSAPLPEPIKLSLAQTEANSNSAASAPAHADGATSDKSKEETIPVPTAPPKAGSSNLGAPIEDDPVKGSSSDSATPSTLPDSATREIARPIMASPSLAPIADAQASLPSADPIAVAEPTLEATPVVIKEVWHIGPEDGTVRQALARWAAKANWTFGADQWELNFDLPIEAPADFEAENFREAIQALSQAIAMTESPVRPCFYANHVLRMIPFTRSCSRTASPTPQT